MFALDMTGIQLQMPEERWSWLGWTQGAVWIEGAYKEISILTVVFSQYGQS